MGRMPEVEAWCRAVHGSGSQHFLALVEDNVHDCGYIRLCSRPISDYKVELLETLAPSRMMKACFAAGGFAVPLVHAPRELVLPFGASIPTRYGAGSRGRICHCLGSVS